MVEYKDQTYRKLKEELMRAQGELQLKDQECGKLERVRDQMEQELEELTASLFEVCLSVYLSLWAWQRVSLNALLWNSQAHSVSISAK